MKLEEKSGYVASAQTTCAGRLYFLEMSGDRIHAINPDGSDHKIVVTGRHEPDGIVVDVEAGHLYWTIPLGAELTELPQR